MICKCGDTGVYNEVNFKGFYYCRTCKIEIELELVPQPDPLTQEEIDELFSYVPSLDVNTVVY